ncbi:MAG TPA: DNA methyltransferase, partial [Ruminococcaceae bacterium]|nr:DNA methyltransferase [Oscillospiraceae bacterium]
LGQNGVGVVLLANGALSAGGEEYEIRKRLIENDRVEAIVILPRNMFYTTDISVTVWILNKNKKSRVEKRPDGDVTFRDRTDEILFMDLRQMGHPYEKKYIELTEEDRAVVVDRFKSWRLDGYKSPYENVPEFCYAAKKPEIAEKDYSLVPSRYIEFINRDESVGYEEKMTQLQGELTELLIQEQQSRQDLLEVMKGLGYEIKL